MSGTKPLAFGMVATPFKEDGSLDEDGFRAHLRWVSDSGCGVYLGSGGSGEGHALSLDEITRVYEIGVEECKGKVPVRANPPEQRHAQGMIAVASAAARAGVDVVQVYQLDAGHGMMPTPAEQEHYYRTVLDAIDHPVAFSIHSYSGYLAPIPMLKRLADDYPHLKTFNAMGIPINYFVALKDALGPEIDYFVGVRQIMEGLPLGAAGFMAAEPNIAPYLCRSIAEHYGRGEHAEFAEAFTNLTRLISIVTRWAPANARWIKMAMKVLGQPGGNGVLRAPYLLPGDDQLAEMKRAFDEFGLSKIEERARTACQS